MKQAPLGAPVPLSLPQDANPGFQCNVFEYSSPQNGEWGAG